MISVIFATKDDEAGLAWSLAALVPAATEGVVRDVTVVDDGSRDGTLVVADAAGCSILRGSAAEGQASRRRSRPRRLAPLPQARGRARSGWQGEALAFIDAALNAGTARETAAVFRLGRAGSGVRVRSAEWLGTLRARLFSAPYEEQGLLISRAFYRTLGGHRPSAAMAGMDLTRRVGRRRLRVLRARAVMLEPPARHRPFRSAAYLALASSPLSLAPHRTARRLMPGR